MNDHLSERPLRDVFPFGFPASAPACTRFGLPEAYAEVARSPGQTDLPVLRRLTHRANEIRERERPTSPPPPFRTEELFVLGSILDALRYMARHYCQHQNPGVLAEGLDWAVRRLGEEGVARLPEIFVDLFPPAAVARGLQTPGQFLQDSPRGLANRDRIVLEIVLLYLTARNPAADAYRELHDDVELQRRAPYVPFVVALEEFFANQPPLAGPGQTLFYVLRAPIQAAPGSLEGQLAYIREQWAAWLPAELKAQLQLAADIWREDRQWRGLGPPPLHALTAGDLTAGLWAEPARFSDDRDWMSNVVLMAKSVYVWLDQLSKRHGRWIRLLSDVPDEELDRLARWGFRGLWLIGVWERSRASRKIKQWTGNREAEASAYSLYDYTIAGDLGGEEAWRDLRDRAWARGIRLASDMVPNHMGIDSRWVIEHPNWFIQLRDPPYPWYTFGGGDLSEDQRVGVFLEDGYWERRDAAVVFKRLDRYTGDVRYIYHGNDGTSMPWNDTAQLNYLLPEVREAVIRTILHVARLFPIIRFDAAMTLAKKHYQRLWFPVPGNAGAVPSRAEHSLSPESFQAAFPAEFWREVVDRVAAEAPDTLLLAEAFWLMEGYFVRTLGMHRVYNSAFMNMLKMEENEKYRQTVKNVLEFSPEVLKRFVNFMNNPDERTAIDQFGKGDKYFGVALMMVTMPGLPMFGHGQVEGLTEKYGMEYRRAYWDEQTDQDMVRRHETEIFPLMRRRRLFSGAENFAFYDFVTPEGHVDENVFAYSNRADGERALILYNNAYQTTRGRIHTSTAINAGRGEETFLVRRTLVEALGLDTSEDCLYSFRDVRSGLRYLRRGRELAAQGLYAELQGYAYNAFLEFEELHDRDGGWHRLADRLGGRGTFDLHTARRELELEPLLDPFRALLALDPGTEEGRPDLAKSLAGWLRAAARELDHQEVTVAEVTTALTDLDHLLHEPAPPTGPQAPGADDFLSREDPGWPRVALAWTAVQALGRLASSGARPTPAAVAKQARQLADDWLLLKAAEDVWRERSGDGHAAHWDARLLEALLGYPNPLGEPTAEPAAGGLDQALADRGVAQFLQIHEHAGERWLHKEQLERLLGAWVRAAGTGAAATTAARVAAAAAAAGYRLPQTLARLAGASPPERSSGSA